MLWRSGAGGVIALSLLAIVSNFLFINKLALDNTSEYGQIKCRLATECFADWLRAPDFIGLGALTNTAQTSIETGFVGNSRVWGHRCNPTLATNYNLNNKLSNNLRYIVLQKKSANKSAQRLPASAKDDKRGHLIDQALDACWEKATTTADQLACASKAQMLWDQELNKNYQLLMAVLNVPSQAALRNAQREWLRFRDAEFKALDEFYGQLSGSMYIPLLTVKKAEVVKQRALLLQQYVTLFDEAR